MWQLVPVGVDIVEVSRDAVMVWIGIVVVWSDIVVVSMDMVMLSNIFGCQYWNRGFPSRGETGQQLNK